jgi:16S rRNA processing protein RimM
MTQAEQADRPGRAEADDDWVVIGTISRTVGLQGLLRVYPVTDHPDRFAPGTTLHHRPRARKESREVRTVCVASVTERADGRSLEMRFVGYDEIETARVLAQGELLIPRAERRPPPPDHFYPDELAGMEIVTIDGSDRAMVESLEADVPSPYLTIRHPRLGEVLIPFRQVFIVSIDRDTRQIVLNGTFEQHVPGGGA